MPNKNISRIKNFKFGLTEIKLLQIKKLIFNLKKKKILANLVVSTDSEIIKKFVSNKYWIKLHDRPKKLAQDDCLDQLIKEVPKICTGKYILWTHVTSPLFDHRDYLSFVEQFFAQKKHKSGFSANLISTFLLNDKNKWISHNRLKKKWPRTQDLKKFYSVNSAAFISSRENYIKFSDRLDNNPLPILTRKGAEFDIDFIDDMKYFKKIFKS